MRDRRGRGPRQEGCCDEAEKSAEGPDFTWSDTVRRAASPRTRTLPATRCDVLRELDPQNVRSPLGEGTALEVKSACENRLRMPTMTARHVQHAHHAHHAHHAPTHYAHHARPPPPPPQPGTLRSDADDAPTQSPLRPPAWPGALPRQSSSRAWEAALSGPLQFVWSSQATCL